MQGKRFKLTLLIMLIVFILFALFGVIVLSLGNNMGIVAIVVGGAAVFPVIGELARQEKRVQNPDGGRKKNDGRDNKEE